MLFTLDKICYTNSSIHPPTYIQQLNQIVPLSSVLSVPNIFTPTRPLPGDARCWRRLREKLLGGGGGGYEGRKTDDMNQDSWFRKVQQITSHQCLKRFRNLPTSNIHESLQLSSSSSSLPAKAWRMAFAFSKIAATLRLVLGP